MKSIEARIAQFNRLYDVYAKPGQTAFQTYQQMKREGYTGVDIASHFGVSQVTASSWNKLFSPKIDSLSLNKE